MPDYMSLDDFVLGPSIGAHCEASRIVAYLRKEGMGIVSVYSMVSRRSGRGRNLYKRDTVLKTGDFGKFMDKLEALLFDNGFRELRFGSVCNEFLPDVLERRGYSKYHNPEWDILPHYTMANPLFLQRTG